MAMNDMNEHESNPIIEAVVGAAYEVANVLGAGFLEKVYENALTRERLLRGLTVRKQVRFPVIYKAKAVGDYYADLVVADSLVVELKCCECFTREHVAQCINYLGASGIRLGLWVNFQRAKVEWRSVVYGYVWSFLVKSWFKESRKRKECGPKEALPPWRGLSKQNPAGYRVAGTWGACPAGGS